MTDTDINKVCAKLMGKCWHEYKKPLTFKGGPILCIKEVCGKGISHLIGFHGRIRRFDPLNNKSDAYDLIQFVVNEWKGWERFLQHEQHLNGGEDGICGEYGHVPYSLLKDQRALPTALAAWDKEGE
jgi:hypothetical protein